MGKTKQQMLNFQAQLEHLGKRLETFSKLNFNNIDIETLGIEYRNTLYDLDAQQNCNRYIWEGLPDYLTGQLIETMLYYRGSLCGFFNAGVLYVLPYAQNKGINVYGQPNAVQPITYNGAMNETFMKVGKELIVSNMGTLNKGAGACILYDRIPAFSQSASPIGRFVLNKEIVDYQCDLLARIKNNLRNIDKKVVFKCSNEAQANQMRKDLREAYGTSDPFVVVVEGAMVEGEKPTTLQGNIDNETQALFETWQSLNSIRCMCSGITNGGAFEKKERKITGELQGDQTQTELVLDAGLKMRELFLNQMKVVYPQYAEILGKIRVKINETTRMTEKLTMNESDEREVQDGEF